MALGFSDIDKKLDKASPTNEIDKVALVKLLAARDFAKSQKINSDDIKATLFAGFLRDDQDSWSYLFRIFGNDYINDLLELRLGERFNWTPEQVAKLLGAKEPINLVKPPKGYDVPNWKIGRGETPEEIIQSYADQYPELDARKLYDWLKAYQDQYDAQVEYTGGAKNAFRTMFRPRAQEALLRGKEPTWKDNLLDLFENVVQAVPFERGVTFGARGLGSAAKMVGNGERAANRLGLVSGLTGAGAAPILTEGADYLLYNPSENASRSYFSPSDVLIGAGVNATTAPVIGGGAERIAKKFGKTAGGRKAVIEEIAGDPAVELELDRIRRTGVGPLAGSKADIQKEIDAEIVKAVEEGAKKKVKSFRNGKSFTETKAEKEARENLIEWFNDLTGSGKDSPKLKKKQQIDEQISNVENPIVKDMAQARIAENAKYVDPALLLEDPYKYGVTETGELAYVLPDNVSHDEVTKIGQGYGIPEMFVNPENSAMSSYLNAHRIPAKMTQSTYDAMFPGRQSTFGRAVEKAKADPEVRRVIEGSKAGSKSGLLKQSAKNFVTNKFGKSEFVPYREQIEGAIPGTVNEDVRAILEDPLTNRIWENTSIRPNFIPGDPLWEAYKIKYPEKAKEIEEQAKKAGKRAGF